MKPHLSYFDKREVFEVCKKCFIKVHPSSIILLPENKLAQPAHCLVDVKKLQPPSAELMEKVINVDKETYKRNLEILVKEGQFDYELEKYLPQYLDVDLDFRLMER